MMINTNCIGLIMKIVTVMNVITTKVNQCKVYGCTGSSKKKIHKISVKSNCVTKIQQGELDKDKTKSITKTDT